MQKNWVIYIKIIVNLLLTILLGVLLLFVGPKLLAFFLPFVVAYILSLIANPLVKFMEKRIKIARKHGSAIIIILVLALIFGLLYLVLSILFREIYSLITDLPNIAQQIAESIEGISTKFASLYEALPQGLKTFLDNLNTSAQGSLDKLLSGVDLTSVIKAGGVVSTFTNTVFMMIITILATYFFIVDRDKIIAAANKILPESIKRFNRIISDNFKTAVGGYFKAQFKIMIILTVVMFITFEFMGINYSILLALTIAVIDFLPVLGTGLVFWPWAVISFINENYVEAIVILVLYLACQIIKQVLQPKMVGDSIGINPFQTLLFMFIGYKLYGIGGMIFGIPIGMVLVSLYRLGMFERITRGIKIIVSGINDFRKY
ncbi:sporulation integral membrane protein YtvI [Lachnoclostridium phytofermentans]|uniref:Sporulation integral membrane protein YtvI n=1 Tax=Lachnoclostridium phytofermentans (strain ATCC 700394 / DSM 18823 / ISDg) TaxID=357809 RepID=A9KHZ2_LACP7|nr:sporulation integral membrane protein YtvI [Lachnoclostridium phytofermentans]ABX43839.1 sporulation integral membrane protein YtvI [Lachnoclostridium phytofermentans ISDg]